MTYYDDNQDALPPPALSDPFLNEPALTSYSEFERAVERHYADLRGERDADDDADDA